MERYARQAMIEGWDQARLRETTLLVMGSGLLARLTGLLAAAMGFGRIVLMGTGRVAEADRRFLLADVPAGASLVRTWAEALGRINPEVEVSFVHDVPCARSFGRIPAPDAIVEASPDVRWKVQALRYAAPRESDLVMASAGPRVGMYSVGRRVCRELLKFQGVREDALVSLALAALVVEEVRRLRLPLAPDDRPPARPVLVSPEALHRRAGGRFPVNPTPEAGQAARIAMVGAGALGTWAGIGLGLAAGISMRLDLYDPDVIEETNLNRQVLFFDAVHRAKAEVLSERLSSLFPQVEAEGKAEAVTEENLAEVCEADLVVCGPDNFATRALLHRGALAHRTPLVNGGASAFGGDVAAYVPGRSPCLECSLRVATVAKAVGEEEHRARCAGVPEASVVTSNALAGALMAFEARAALAGRPAGGVIEYDGRAVGQRLGVRSVRKPCACHLERR